MEQSSFMIKAIIVDDEEKSRIALKNLVVKHCTSVEIVDLCESVDHAEISIARHSPQLVFLDIEMPFKNGFTLIEKITKPAFDVIFTTAYDQYAIRAIRYSALDYLLKPVDVEELKSAVKRTTDRRADSSGNNYELLLASLKMRGKVSKIAVPTFDGLQMVNVQDIVKCIADESYTHIKMVDGSKITVSRILKEFEDLLSESNFIRVHNSSLINIVHVKKYVKGEGGYVIMSDDETVEVSRRKKAELLAKLAVIHS